MADNLKADSSHIEHGFGENVAADRLDDIFDELPAVGIDEFPLFRFLVNALVGHRLFAICVTIPARHLSFHDLRVDIVQTPTRGKMNPENVLAVFATAPIAPNKMVLSAASQLAAVHRIFGTIGAHLLWALSVDATHDCIFILVPRMNDLLIFFSERLHRLHREFLRNRNAHVLGVAPQPKLDSIAVTIDAPLATTETVAGA